MALSFDTNGGSLDRRNSSGGSFPGGRRYKARRLGDKKMNAALMQLYRWNWIPYAILAAFCGWALFDAFVPVVWMRGDVVSKGPDYAVVHMSGYKLRECRYLGIQAYSLTDGVRFDAKIKRLDTGEVASTRPRGFYDIGNWEVRPTAGASGVVIYAQHACGDDVRMTKMAELQI
jgi:hypothetical protein